MWFCHCGKHTRTLGPIELVVAAVDCRWARSKTTTSMPTTHHHPLLLSSLGCHRGAFGFGNLSQKNASTFMLAGHISIPVPD